MAPITFYHFNISAPSRSALLTARNCNLDVQIKELNLLAKDQLNPDFVKLNPQHTVPTIDDNGFILWESRAIAEYFVTKYAPDSGLVPTDPKERAVMAQRLYFDAGTYYVRIRAICFPVLFLGETKIPADKRKDLLEAFEWLNGFLEGKSWFAGDRVTIADLAILASTATIVQVGADLSPYKNLSAWYERCKTLPGWEENNAGAKVFGDRVKGNLKETL